VEEEEEDLQAMSLHLYDEAFISLALSAKAAVSSMEEALLFQEKTLSEARLLRAQREDPGQDTSVATPSRSSSHPDPEEEPLRRDADLLSERFCALRHAVDARRLQWRLQVEKHRTESLVLELQMRDKFQKELEGSLAEAKARLVEAEELAAAAAKSKAAPGAAATRIPSPRAHPAKVADGAAANRDKPRIVRPVPRTRRAPGSPVRSKTTPLPSSDGQEVVQKEVTSPLASPRKRISSAVSGNSAEDVLWVAGTGDTGSETTVAVAEGLGTGAAASAGNDAKTEQRVGQAVSEAMVLLDGRSAKLRELRRELHSRDLQISALRHQIRIKDALLTCLQDEERLRFETQDAELEVLLEKALTPLTAILTREQTAHAVAAGSRVEPAGQESRRKPCDAHVGQDGTTWSC